MIYNLLEDRFELLLANAAHLKAVPGRKTDVRDAEWIAELFRHGLLRASFIPPRAERELRELVRYRTSLIRISSPSAPGPAMLRNSPTTHPPQGEPQHDR